MLIITLNKCFCEDMSKYLSVYQGSIYNFIPESQDSLGVYKASPTIKLLCPLLNFLLKFCGFWDSLRFKMWIPKQKMWVQDSGNAGKKIKGIHSYMYICACTVWLEKYYSSKMWRNLCSFGFYTERDGENAPSQDSDLTSLGTHSQRNFRGLLKKEYLVIIVCFLSDFSIKNMLWVLIRITLLRPC